MHWKTKITLVSLTAIAVSSCSPSAEKSQIEFTTVDVQPQVDVALTTAYDEKAIVYGDTVAGVLPGDFPKDIPLYAPASLIDMGSTQAGRPFVVLATPDENDRVNQGVTRKLATTGWEKLSTDSTGLTTFGRASRRIWIRVETSGALTEITVEYVSDR
jgi:hypothetical protein